MSNMDYVRYSISDSEYDTDILNRTRLAILINKLHHSNYPVFSDFFDADVNNNDRLQRALDEKMQFIGPPGTHRILYSSSGHQYDVSLSSCTCPDYTYRHRPCKHMYRLAIDYVLSLPVRNADPVPDSMPTRMPTSQSVHRTPSRRTLPSTAPIKVPDPIPSPASSPSPAPKMISPKKPRHARWYIILCLVLLFLISILWGLSSNHATEPVETLDNTPSLVQHITERVQSATPTPVPTATLSPSPSPTPTSSLSAYSKPTPAPTSTPVSHATGPMFPSGTTTPRPTSTPQPAAVDYDYVLNTNTKKFHYPTCYSVNQMNEENKQFYSGSREEVIAMGFSPCGNCHP